MALEKSAMDFPSSSSYEISPSRVASTRQRSGSLWATLGLAIEYARSEAAIEGRPWRGGGLADVEAKDLWQVDGESARQLFWRCTSRFQPSVWAAKMKGAVVKETVRLEGLIEREYDLVTVSFGMAWGGWSGPEMRAWFDSKIKLLSRWNTGQTAAKNQVFLVMATPQISVEAGPGLVRPSRPHWHLVLAVARKNGGADRRFRLLFALTKLKSLLGVSVFWDGRFLGLAEAKEGSVARLVGYLLRYPISLKSREIDGGGRRLEIPFRAPSGLRLSDTLPRGSGLQRVRAGAMPPLPCGWDGLTDPVVLVPCFEALAEFKCLRTYAAPSGFSEAKEGSQANLSAPCNSSSSVPVSPLAVRNPPKKRDFPMKKRPAKPPPNKGRPNQVLTRWVVEDPKTGLWRTCALVRNFTRREEFELANPDLAEQWKIEKTLRIFSLFSTKERPFLADFRPKMYTLEGENKHSLRHGCSEAQGPRLRTNPPPSPRKN
jgi:hypothetical protein